MDNISHPACVQNEQSFKKIYRELHLVKVFQQRIELSMQRWEGDLDLFMDPFFNVLDGAEDLSKLAGVSLKRVYTIVTGFFSPLPKTLQ